MIKLLYILCLEVYQQSIVQTVKLNDIMGLRKHTSVSKHHPFTVTQGALKIVSAVFLSDPE